MRKFYASFMIIALVLIAAGTASAITGSIGNGRMLLRVNISNSEPTTIDKHLLINNVNPYPVNVTITPTGDLKDITDLSAESLTLDAGSNLSVPFSITVTEQKDYEGKLLVKFTQANDSRAIVTLASAINIIVTSLDGTSAQLPGSTEEQDNGIAEEQNVTTEPPAGQDNSTAVPNPNAPNPLVGMLIVLAIVVVGLAAYTQLLPRR